jgi:hypothetical protein
MTHDEIARAVAWAEELLHGDLIRYPALADLLVMSRALLALKAERDQSEARLTAVEAERDAELDRGDRLEGMVDRLTETASQVPLLTTELQVALAERDALLKEKYQTYQATVDADRLAEEQEKRQ